MKSIWAKPAEIIPMRPLPEKSSIKKNDLQSRFVTCSSGGSMIVIMDRGSPVMVVSGALNEPLGFERYNKTKNV